MSERVGKGKAISTAYARGILLSPLSSLSSLSSLSPLSSVLFLSSLPQVATGFCKNAPRVERKPSVSQFAPRVERKPCLSVSVPCSRTLSDSLLVMFKKPQLRISGGLFCDLFSLLAFLAAAHFSERSAHFSLRTLHQAIDSAPNSLDPLRHHSGTELLPSSALSS